MVKAMNSFRAYVLHSKIIAYVPSSIVKDILNQPHIDGRRGKWIENIQEYDLEIKPTKLVKGRCLTKLLAESNCRALGINLTSNTIEHLSANLEETKLHQPFKKIY